MTEQELSTLLSSFKAKIKHRSAALVFFSGYGIQSSKQSYIIPVDAKTVKQHQRISIEHAGISIESILEDVNAAGATVKLVIVELRSRFEQRLRDVSLGLAPAGTLAVFSAGPDEVTNDSEGTNSLFITELLKEMRTPGLTATEVFNDVRARVSRATNGKQVPSVSSSLKEEFFFLGTSRVMMAPPVDAARPVVIGREIERPVEQPPVDARAGIVETVEQSPVDAARPVEIPPSPRVQAAPNVIERFPTIEADDRIRAGATTTVQVSLTVEQETPEVKIRKSGRDIKATQSGTLKIPTPSPISSQVITVILRANGFDLETPEEATIELDPSGDSTIASFRIKARAEAIGARMLRVTFWRDGEFLALVARQIVIVPHEDGAGPAAPPSPSSTAARRPPKVPVAAPPRPVDLTVQVIYDDPRQLGQGRVTIASPYFNRTVQGAINTAPDIVDWLAKYYREFRAAGTRGGYSADKQDDTGRREQVLTRVRAFGEELYRRAAPRALRDALWVLLGNPAVQLRTMQVYSNSPLIPWELMRAPKPNGESTDFFGIAFALARWHEDDDVPLTLRPPQDQPVAEVAAIAPAYSDQKVLRSQGVEIDAIQNTINMRRVPGRRSDFISLMRDPPKGIIHFAGHGEVVGANAAERSFAIDFEDGSFDVMDWRGLPVIGSRVLFFFNACDVGQAELVAGAIEGWGPAVLSRGAAGYIGGLWPLRDDSAARFAIAFYRSLSNQFALQRPAIVAEALANARRLFYETADPTFLAYAFYGDAQLMLLRQVSGR